MLCQVVIYQKKKSSKATQPLLRKAVCHEVLTHLT